MYLSQTCVSAEFHWSTMNTALDWRSDRDSSLTFGVLVPHATLEPQTRVQEQTAEVTADHSSWSFELSASVASLIARVKAEAT